MIEPFARYFPLAILLGMVVTYGGFVAPSLWWGLIGLAGLLTATVRREKGLSLWPDRRTEHLLLILLAGALLQLTISPNRWATAESIMWAFSAFIFSAIFAQDPEQRAGDRWVALTVVTAAAIQAALLPYTTVWGTNRSGTFVSPNHTAALLIFGFWVAWRTGKVLLFGFSLRGGQARTLVLAGLFGAMLLTFSAGAFCAFGIALLLFFLRKRVPARFSVPAAFALLLTAQITLSFLTPHGESDRRLATVLPTKVSDPDRKAMVRTAVALLGERPLTGHGLSAYPELFPSKADIETTYRVANFAHNDLLQLAAELGLPLALLAIFLMWGLFRALGAPCQLEDIGRHRLRQATLWGGVTLLFHSLVDFPWHAPALFLLFVTLSASSLPTEAKPNRRSAWILAAVSACLLPFALVSGYSRWTVRDLQHLDRSARWSIGNPAPAVTLGRRLLKDGNYRYAAFQLGRAVRRAPYNADAREYYGMALAAAGQGERAAEELKKAADLDPMNGKRLIRISRWLVSRGYAAAGVEAASRLRDVAPAWGIGCFDVVSLVAFDPGLLQTCIHPGRPKESLALAEYLRANGQLQAALGVALDALPDALTDAYLFWYFDLAKRTGRVQTTLDRLESVPRKGPNHPHLLRLQAKLLLLQEQAPEAAAALDEAALLQGYPGGVWVEMKEVLYALADLKSCEEVAARWQGRWPKSPYPFLADAVCASKDQRYARALSGVQQALRNDPGNAEAWWLEVDLWQRRGLPDRAVDTACKARVPEGSAAAFLRYCLTGLGSTRRCPELRKAWGEQASFGLAPSAWLELQASLRGDANVQACLEAK